jgi:hypothetical protein
VNDGFTSSDAVLDKVNAFSIRKEISYEEYKRDVLNETKVKGTRSIQHQHLEPIAVWGIGDEGQASAPTKTTCTAANLKIYISPTPHVMPRSTYADVTAKMSFLFASVNHDKHKAITTLNAPTTPSLVVLSFLSIHKFKITTGTTGIRAAMTPVNQNVILRMLLSL